MAKADINDTYVSEMVKYQDLVALGSTRSATGGTWTSTSSSTVYSYTSETDLMSQLLVVLTPYIITASDWNSNTTSVSDLTNTLTHITRTSFQTFMSGWKF